MGKSIEGKAKSKISRKLRAERIGALKDKIRRRLLRHLHSLGFTREKGTLKPPGETKEIFRALHRKQRAAKLRQNKKFLQKKFTKVKKYFADGAEVVPANIQPRLHLVESNTWQSDLFRVASLIWSVPVSQGYGRRMRFLVMDESNEKLIGIIGLTDPVFNLRVRDDLIGWTAADRKKRLVNMMDAFVLGAVPPYSFLLGGKLVACLLRTREIRDAFGQKYKGKRGIISKTRKHPHLAVITTSSALGRSSLYNRLRLRGNNYMESIGETEGWGHFHMPTSLFVLMRKFLARKRHEYSSNHQFGDGPNWKMRAIREACKLVGLKEHMLRHGIHREVFVCKLTPGAFKYLKKGGRTPTFNGLYSCKHVGKLARERWIIPRAERRPDYIEWEKNNIRALLSARFKRRTVRGVAQRRAA